MMKIRIDGKDYSFFTDKMLSVSLGTLAGEYTFTATVNPETQSIFPIRTGMSCEILVNDTVKLTGTVEIVNVGYDSDSHTIGIAGRDITADIVDSTIGGNIGFTEQKISLKKVTETILSYMGITGITVNVPSGIDDFSLGDVIDASTGDSVFDYLDKFARKRQLILTTSGNGDINYVQADQPKKNDFKLLNLANNKGVNNILSASVDYNVSAIYRNYIVRSQSAISAANSSSTEYPVDLATNIVGSVVDKFGRATRTLNILSETSLNTEEAKKRAKWQANINRAKSFRYTCEVQGHSLPDGSTFELNTLYRIIDDFCDLDLDMLLNSITWSESLSSGTKTQLDFIPKDAYKLELLALDQAVKENKSGVNFADIEKLLEKAKAVLGRPDE